jgi:hypothetical protein
MNNRELATFILLGFGLLLMLLSRDLRGALKEILKQLLSPKLAVPLMIFTGWTLLAVWTARAAGFWTADLIGSTGLWFLFVGLVWFVHLGDAGRDADFFKRRVLEAAGIGAVLEFFVNLEVMSLPAELAFLVFAMFVAMLDAVAHSKVGFRPVARLTSSVLVLIGIGLIANTIDGLRDNWHALVVRDIVNQLLLPVWLTTAAVPCIYLIALYAGYESLFMNMRFWNDKRRPSVSAFVGVIAELRGSLIDISGFQGISAKHAARTRSFHAARRSVRDFKHSRAEDQAARLAAQDRLKQFVGVPGVDAEGQLLDRREFAQTKSALRWIATCHMGWYQRDDLPDAYRLDLLTMLGDFVRQGIPEDHGIAMKVRKDGQSWYAYRTTPAGHVFAIGANAAPPSQWFYDGVHPPSGFPSTKSGWSSFMDPERPEWNEEEPTD